MTQSERSAEASRYAHSVARKAEVAEIEFETSSVPDREESSNFVIFIPNIKGQRIKVSTTKSVRIGNKNTGRYYESFSDGDKIPEQIIPDQYVISVGILDRNSFHQNPDGEGAISYDALFELLHMHGYDPLEPLRNKGFQSTWEKRLGETLISCINRSGTVSKSSIESALLKVGKTIRDICRDYIFGGEKPDLSRNTIYWRRAKEEAYNIPYNGDHGIEEPLCESGQLAEAISVEVVSYTSKMCARYFIDRRKAARAIERERIRRKKERDAERKALKKKRDAEKKELARLRAEARRQQKELERQSAEYHKEEVLLKAKKRNATDARKALLRGMSALERAESIANERNNEYQKACEAYDKAYEHYNNNPERDFSRRQKQYETVLELERKMNKAGAIAENAANYYNGLLESYNNGNTSLDDKPTIEQVDKHASRSAKSETKTANVSSSSNKKTRTSIGEKSKNTRTGKPKPTKATSSKKTTVPKPQMIHGYRRDIWDNAENLWRMAYEAGFKAFTKEEKEQAKKDYSWATELMMKKAGGYKKFLAFKNSRGRLEK